MNMNGFNSISKFRNYGFSSKREKKVQDYLNLSNQLNYYEKHYFKK